MTPEPGDAGYELNVARAVDGASVVRANGARLYPQRRERVATASWRCGFSVCRVYRA
jgi:hypothetical protein